MVLLDANDCYEWVNRLDPTLSWDVLAGRHISSVLPPDSVETVMTAIATCRETGESVYYEALGYSEGEFETWYGCRVVPAPPDDHGNSRVLILSSDVTKRRLAEKALEASEERFRRLVEGSPGWILLIGRDRAVEYVNRPLDVEGQGVEVLGRKVDDFIHEEDRTAAIQTIETAFETGQPGRYLSRGSMVEGHHRVEVMPLSAETALLSSVDISDEVLAARQREDLLAELDHRVKNTLATVLSLATRSIQTASSLNAFKETFLTRLRGMARAHELMASSGWHGVQLESLVNQVVGPVDSSHWINRLSEGANPRLDPATATPLALALAELATNAAKHGAFSARGGTVEVSCKLEAEQLVFTWRESFERAVEHPTGAPFELQPGFGLRLVRGIFEHDLDGTLQSEFGPTGLTHVGRFKLGAT